MIPNFFSLLMDIVNVAITGLEIELVKLLEQDVRLRAMGKNPTKFSRGSTKRRRITFG